MAFKKQFFFTNVILIGILLSIYFIGFIPSNTITISGTNSYSAIYNGNRQNNKIALMINVYENPENVVKIVDIFKENNVVGTFFVGGSWADDNQETIKYAIKHGNEIGNHGYFHKDHKKLSENENYNEIKNNHKIVYSLTGYNMTLFAPPSGSYSKTTLKVASNLNYKTIMWSKDTIDWRDSDLSLIISRATKNAENGDLILLHPKNHTVVAIKEIIKILKNKGFELTTVSECIAK